LGSSLPTPIPLHPPSSSYGFRTGSLWDCLSSEHGPSPETLLPMFRYGFPMASTRVPSGIALAQGTARRPESSCPGFAMGFLWLPHGHTGSPWNCLSSFLPVFRYGFPMGSTRVPYIWNCLSSGHGRSAEQFLSLFRYGFPMACTRVPCEIALAQRMAGRPKSSCPCFAMGFLWLRHGFHMELPQLRAWPVARNIIAPVSVWVSYGFHTGSIWNCLSSGHGRSPKMFLPLFRYGFPMACTRAPYGIALAQGMAGRPKNNCPCFAMGFL
jgi:hypothetical protein